MSVISLKLASLYHTVCLKYYIIHVKVEKRMVDEYKGHTREGVSPFLFSGVVELDWPLPSEDDIKKTL
jgi:hypothetical protein